MFPGGPSYRIWAVLFSALSFLVANLGLSAIISWSMPVLMFLYPLAITLILLTLSGRFFENDRRIYCWVTGFTSVAAGVDFLNALPEEILSFLHLKTAAEAAADILPFSGIGFGWICPALMGLILGIIHHFYHKGRV